MKLVTTGLLFFLLLCLPGAVAAQVEWAAWGNPAGTVNTGSFGGGQVVTLTSHFDGITAGVTGGTEYSASPAFPGRSDGKNPTFMRAITGSPHPSVLVGGAQVASLDLIGVAPDSNLTFGLGDLKSGNWYRLVLQDGSGTTLSLAGVRLANHNITYVGSSLVADYDVTLNTADGLILVTGIHDVPGAFYGHSGVALFSKLPTATRRIIVLTGTSQETEGIQIYLGITPTTATEKVTWGSLKSLPWR